MIRNTSQIVNNVVVTDNNILCIIDSVYSMIKDEELYHGDTLLGYINNWTTSMNTRLNYGSLKVSIIAKNNDPEVDNNKANKFIAVEFEIIGCRNSNLLIWNGGYQLTYLTIDLNDDTKTEEDSNDEIIIKSRILIDTDHGTDILDLTSTEEDSNDENIENNDNTNE